MTAPEPLKTTLVFLRRDDQVLLAMKKRRFGEGKWNGAGGKVDEGETVPEAAIRECQEEVDVTPTVYDHVAILRFRQHEQTHPTMNNDCYVYLVTEWQGKPAETEEMAPQWFDIDKLPFDRMWPDDPHWLPRVLAGEKLEADILFDESATKIIEMNISEVGEFGHE